LPGLELLDKVDPNKKVNFTAEQLARLSELLEIKLQEFNVKAQVVEAQPGPVVTRFELDLAPGVKASKVTNISRDLRVQCRWLRFVWLRLFRANLISALKFQTVREMVRLIELLMIPAFTDPNSILSMAMGKDISGNPVIADLGKAPHMLVAGTTGSGKSVAVNSMILSMLLKYTPDQLRLILIDPKQLELANYNDIPHLLTPVVTDMKDAVSALNWCVNEMERRYKLMSF
jgi:S-DNA-T family DNA segregation ATPase FtsK/SpoIIIE